MAFATVIALDCGAHSERPIADLVELLPVARKQPADNAFQAADVTVDGITRRSIVARDQTRLTCHVTVPKHARFRVAVAVDPRAWSAPGSGVLFLVGVSDGRWYQTKGSLTVDPFSNAAARRWHYLDFSLEEFAGFTIDIVLNTRPAGNAATPADTLHAVWGMPVVVAR
jgi:hypothetical protein